MDFEDFLKKKQKSGKKRAILNHYGYDSKSYTHRSNARFDPNAFVNKIRNNNKFKIIFLVVFVIITVIIIGIISILFSLISSVYSYSDLNEISGLLEKAINFLNNL